MKILARLALALPLLAAAADTPGGTHPGKTEVTWMGHAAFVVKTPGGTVLAIDPWLTNPANPDKESMQKIERVDFILVSHGHSDHVGDAIALAQKTGAKLVTTFDLMKVLVGAGYPKDQATMATAGNVGGTIELAPGVAVTLVPAVHGSTFQKDATSPIEAGGTPTGFVVQIQGGPTLYHTGDTAVTSDMKLVGDRFPIDVMFACIGGHFTMDPVDAATAVRLVRAKAVVPMHFGTFPVLRGTPAELEAALRKQGSNAKVVTMKPGETRAF
jgi:L-ascorbate metabolism protein UlaG (beta-lactamase superfamily)